MKDRGPLLGKMRLFILLSLFVLILELAGGIYTKSLALLGDSFHVLFDLIALSLVYFSLKLSTRSATGRYSFGFYRAEIFSAIVNAVLLVVTSVFLFYESFRRLVDPYEIRAPEMLVISVIGLAANLYVVWGMHGYDKNNLNVRGAYLHVLGDALTSVAVVAGAVIILFTGFTIVDPILTVLIGIVMLYGSIRLIRESVNVLMEAVPRGVDIGSMLSDMKKVKGVLEVHDLHVWSISSDIRAASAHVLISDDDAPKVNVIIKKINRLLKEHHNIDHTVIQVECGMCAEGASGNGRTCGSNEDGCHSHGD